VADPVLVFALLSEYRLVPADRSARAGGTALRAGGVPRPEASQAGGVVDQGPTARILTLLTYRPDFTPPWTGRAHVTHVTLPRLPRRQAAEMTGRVAHGKALPVEVTDQVVAKTDGVPLFVEELTKMVLESGLLEERENYYALIGPLPPSSARPMWKRSDI
jgi:hypothetical protein